MQSRCRLQLWYTKLFLKLAGSRHPFYENRAHFFGIASRLMRQVLVDSARARAAEKRGAAREVAVAELPDRGTPPNQRLLEIEDALARLEKAHALQGHLKAFLASNMKASAQALTKRIASMEVRDWRVVAVGAFYKGVTSIGLVLSLWDFRSNWSKSDTLEKVVLFGTVAASLGMFLGSLGITSWLGPAGVVVGVVIGLISLAYQWFKTGLEQTLRGLLDSFQDTAFYKSNCEYSIASKQVYIIFTKTTTLEDLCDDLSQAIAKFHWKDPEIGYVIEYVRAGITDEALAKIYDRDLDEIKKVVSDQWYALEKYESRTAATRIEVLLPEPGVKLVVGGLSPIRVAVYDGDNVGYAFLEADPQWYGGDPSVYLTDFADDDFPSTYDIDRKSVILNIENEKTKNCLYFRRQSEAPVNASRKDRPVLRQGSDGADQVD